MSIAHESGILEHDATHEITSARLSHDGVYRYRLDRTWDRPAGRLLFVMLNPSTADGTVDDPTIRRCRGFTLREGLGGFTVVNLFALRATDPKHLRQHPDPVGPLCDVHLRLAALGEERPRAVIAAWGAHPFAADRAAEVVDLFAENRQRLSCLGVTKGGHPRHPLYVKGDTPLLPYPVRR